MTYTPATTHQTCLNIQSDLKAFLHGEYQSNVERQGQIKGHLFACEDCTQSLAEIMVEESDRLAETAEVSTKEALPSLEILNVLGVAVKQGVYHWEKLKQFAKQDWKWAKEEMDHLTGTIKNTLLAAAFVEETENVSYAHLAPKLPQDNILMVKRQRAPDQQTAQEIPMEILTPPTVTTEGKFVLRLRSDDITLEGLPARCFFNTVEQMQIVFEEMVSIENDSPGVQLTIHADDFPLFETDVKLPLDQIRIEIQDS